MSKRVNNKKGNRARRKGAKHSHATKARLVPALARNHHHENRQAKGKAAVEALSWAFSLGKR